MYKIFFEKSRIEDRLVSLNYGNIVKYYVAQGLGVCLLDTH